MNITIKLPDKDFFSPREVAKALDLHVSTVFRFMLKGVRGAKLRWHLIGARRRIGRAEFLAWLEAINDDRHDTKPESRRDQRARHDRDAQFVERQLDAENLQARTVTTIELTAGKVQLRIGWLVAGQDIRRAARRRR
jgi:hypothetical protein